MSFIAAAGTVGAAVGLSGTAAIIGGGALIGAGVGGLYSAVTGDGDILGSALTGGLLGATAGAGGAAFGGGAAAGGAAAAGEGAAITGGAAAAGEGAALTGANVAGNAAVMGPTYAELGYTGANTIPAAMGPTYAELGYTPSAGSAGSAAAGSAAAKAAATQGGLTGSDVLLGTLGLGYLTQKENNKYGVPANTPYDGPLNDFKYNRENYTPLTATPPNPAYKPQYVDYRATPYKSAAQGGVMKMATGGIAMANPSVGPVEQMSRDNATGSNMMFPQAAINSPSFASATNRPMTQNVIPSVADINVDPYTGTERFAEGGLAATPQAQQAPQTLPDQITRGSMGFNDAMMARLQGAVNSPAVQQTLTQNPLQQAPAQVPAQNPFIQAQPYAAPTFTRATPTAIPFQNPKAIVGTTAYKDEQARIAAEAEAARQAELAAQMSRASMSGNDSGGGAAGGLMPGALRYDIGGFVERELNRPGLQVQGVMDNPTQALIGANTPFETQVWNGVTGSNMRPTTDMYGRPVDKNYQLKEYQMAKGGTVQNTNMQAIDQYMAQAKSDPAAVMAKAKAGDYNAMVAINKLKNTPNQNYAAGGHLGGYSDGGRMLKGPGDGMSDNIPATIGGKQPARLADGEFVVPADVVSHLGNGSSDAGAKHLYNMMDKVRKARTGNKKQGKQIKPEKFLKG